MKKIIAVDIDGTLLNSKKEISPRTKKSLIGAQEKGNIVVIASGRDFSGVKRYADILKLDIFDGLVSSNNGCLITNYKNGNLIVNHSLSIQEAKEILAFSKDLNCNPILFKDGKIISDIDNEIVRYTCEINKMDLVVSENIYDNLDFRPNNIVFCHIEPEVLTKVYEEINEKYSRDYSFVKSTIYHCEIMPKGINKGSSLIDIASYYKIDIENVIAFGDEGNDLDMIKKAGVGVAMGNAIDEVKEAADYITLSNDEDGIADYLEKFEII